MDSLCLRKKLRGVVFSQEKVIQRGGDSRLTLEHFYFSSKCRVISLDTHPVGEFLILRT